MARDRARQLEQVEDEIRRLKESPLYDHRRDHGYRSVPGEGDPGAALMFVGEAPGEQEARTGRPFVGRAGRILDELLQGIGLDRQRVYITNIVKDRPPANRDPTREEIRVYAPFLRRQIEIVQPGVIATLGRFAMEFILAEFDMEERGGKISRLHGRALKARAPYGEIDVLPLYHPAVVLYAPARRETLRQDFETLRRLI